MKFEENKKDAAKDESVLRHPTSSSQKLINQIRERYENGEISIDKNGIALNKIGRPLFEDEVCALSEIVDGVNIEATNEYRKERDAKFIEEYIERQKKHVYKN